MDPELVSAVRDELTIGFIANEVPMEPELSPEPDNTPPDNISGVRKQGELELERRTKREERLAALGKQVAEERNKQGEAEERKEEEEMFKRVLEAVGEKENKRMEGRKEGECSGEGKGATKSQEK